MAPCEPAGSARSPSIGILWMFFGCTCCCFSPRACSVLGGVVSEPEMTLSVGHASFMEPSPYGIPSKKLTMWLFIISDAVTFGAVLFGYSYLRIGTPNWPTPFQFSPSVINGLIMTFVLLTSSLTMLGAVANAKQGRKAQCLKWMGVTIVLGI